jgi:hypothetical protein
MGQEAECAKKGARDVARGGRSENGGLLPALRGRASALLRLVAAPQIFVRHSWPWCRIEQRGMDRRQGREPQSSLRTRQEGV